MTKTNYLICPGEACPIRLICRRFQEWINNEDDDADEMTPAFKNGECTAYVAEPFYGG